MVSGRIVIGKKTAEHKAFLMSHGYTVTDGDGFIEVQGTGFMTELDLGKTDESAREAVKKVVAAKQLLTYKSKVTFPDGKVLTAIPLCSRLGKVSAIVVKDNDDKEPEKQPNPFDSI